MAYSQGIILDAQGKPTKPTFSQLLANDLRQVYITGKDNDLWGPTLYDSNGKLLPTGPKGKFLFEGIEASWDDWKK